MALVEPREKKLVAVRKKLEKELKSPTLTQAQKKTINRDIKALKKVIVAMESAMKMTNHNIC